MVFDARQGGIPERDDTIIQHVCTQPADRQSFPLRRLQRVVQVWRERERERETERERERKREREREREREKENMHSSGIFSHSLNVLVTLPSEMV